MKTTTVRRLGRNDLSVFQQLLALFERVFDEPGQAPDPEGLLESPLFIALAALQGEEVCGGLTAYILPSYRQPRPEVFVYDVAIAGTHQRQGLGTKLLDALKDYSPGDIWVAAHERDEGALAFYRATGGAEERVVHFTYAPPDR
jgi:aminoglycoside 3-N-acetyltransferase I